MSRKLIIYTTSTMVVSTADTAVANEATATVEAETQTQTNEGDGDTMQNRTDQPTWKYETNSKQ